jgi:hypothetical protein
MRRILATLLPLLLLSAAQAQTATKFTREQLLEDFHILKQALEEGHSGVYRYSSKADMDRVFERAEKSIDRPMDAYEFYRVLARVIAAVKCGHTGVQSPEEMRKEILGQLLPLEVRILDRRVFVYRDFSSAEHDLAGKEIVAINGVPASKIVAAILETTPGDGDVMTSRQAAASGWRFCTQLVSLMGMRSPYDVTLADHKTKREQKARIVGMELSKLREASRAAYPQDQPKPRPGELEFLDDGKIAVMKIRQFGGLVDVEQRKGLKPFFKESFEEIQAKGSKSLVIDLRNNGGGQDELGKLLLSYLIDKPFKYYDDLILNSLSFDFLKYTAQPGPIPGKMFEQGKDGKYHWIGHPNWGINQPSKPTFTGKVFILINGASFSTTSEFLSQAHFNRRATFIGEESGGGYYGNTSGYVPMVTLPNTKFAIFLPLVTYYMAVNGYKAAAHGVMPDHTVKYTIEELLAGRDKDMEVALSLARK